MLSTPSPDEGGRKARVAADHDDGEDHEVRSSSRSSCRCRSHINVSDVVRVNAGRTESWPIMMMVKIMLRSTGRSDAAAATEAASTGRGRKARVVADHDDDEDHEEEEQQKVELPPPKPHQRVGCCPRQRRMHEEKWPESWPIVTLMKIMK